MPITLLIEYLKKKTIKSDIVVKCLLKGQALPIVISNGAIDLVTNTTTYASKETQWGSKITQTTYFTKYIVV